MHKFAVISYQNLVVALVHENSLDAHFELIKRHEGDRVGWHFDSRRWE